MAFFNLTKLGVQDPISASLKENPTKEKLMRTEEQSSKKQQEESCSSPINKQSNKSDSQGSYVKYTERLTKHQRSSYDPNELYSKPVTSSQDYGWWKNDGAPQSLPWTSVQRCSRVNSEMTRFVDEMTLTNKHFTLF